MQTVPFLSWDMIQAGALLWTKEGRSSPCEAPSGIELKVQPARKSKPVLRADRPWESGEIGWVQVMADDGKYRMWYGTGYGDHPKHLCYAESDDGRRWRKPSLGVYAWNGSTDNNICRGGPGANESFVFKDPTAPPEARYRCLAFKSYWGGAPGEVLSNEEGMRRLKLRDDPAATGEKPPVSLNGTMVGFNSPDGFRWTPIEKPVLDEWHDTQNIAVYDPLLKKYVGYFRGFHGGRRAVARAETDDFTRWPSPTIVHHALPQDAPDTSLYSNGYTTYPGRPDIRLMFPGMFHQATDVVDAELAVSLDGVNWVRHAQQPIIRHGRPGRIDQAYIYPGPDLLRFPDGTFRILYRGGAEYHNQGYVEGFTAASFSEFYHAAWAVWTEDRLVGISAKKDGEFTMGAEGNTDRIVANYRTEPDGWIRFEVCAGTAFRFAPQPGAEGFRFEDSDPIQGDETHRQLTWRNNADLSRFKTSGFLLRVKLHRATLFALTFYGADEPSVRADPRFPA